ncbi:PTS sugar transporter subunit IIA [Robertmurraya korlensis]|uniref:PTS sugar transporter subunit IIA n=1 Tax=Robertmurraya korlensis TaxID=519977 RepID=UPI000824F836|nr:PTS sugar transporter subunit IIA [Robertmurraya korlensis]
MNRFLIASHGNLAKEIVNTVHMIMGTDKNLEYIGVNPETTIDEVKEKLNNFLESGEDGDQFCILTDVFGGSITNICTELITRHDDVHILTGVNLPMVLEVINAPPSLSCTEVIDLCITRGKESFIYVNKILYGKENRK